MKHDWFNNVSSRKEINTMTCHTNMLTAEWRLFIHRVMRYGDRLRNGIYLNEYSNYSNTEV